MSGLDDRLEARRAEEAAIANIHQAAGNNPLGGAQQLEINRHQAKITEINQFLKNKSDRLIASFRFAAQKATEMVRTAGAGFATMFAATARALVGQARAIQHWWYFGNHPEFKPQPA